MVVVDVTPGTVVVENRVVLPAGVPVDTVTVVVRLVVPTVTVTYEYCWPTE
jgi:hypothetical protein